jgi:nucleotide-binding universal stress UspA family protein
MYQRILVPLDGSPTAEAGLREAVGLAAALKAKLVLLHVIDDFGLMVEMSSVASYESMREGLRKFGQDALARAKQAAADAGVMCETMVREVPQARIAEVINDEAAKDRCDLVVMGTHGRRGFSRLTLGSNAEAVMRTSTVPVLLVRAAAPA